MLTLHDTIKFSIIAQSVRLMTMVKENYKDWKTNDEMRSWLDHMIFNVEDVLSEQLNSIGLSVSDINTNEFRKQQRLTIVQCCELYEIVKALPTPKIENQ